MSEFWLLRKTQKQASRAGIQAFVSRAVTTMQSALGKTMFGLNDAQKSIARDHTQGIFEFTLYEVSQELLSMHL
jgi:hypothetical protein